jgi:DNA-binding NarL/FixJ family response regulator
MNEGNWFDWEARVIRTTVVTERYILSAALRMTLSSLGPVVAVSSVAHVIDCDLLVVELCDYSAESFRALAALGRPTLVWCDSASVELGTLATDCGINGLIGDDASERQIVSAASAVARGELWIPAEPDAETLSKKPLRLTPRESQLVTLLCRGLRNKEIAVEMRVTEGTVKVYLSRLFEKTGARDRFDLTMLTFRNQGMLSAMPRLGEHQRSNGVSDTAVMPPSQPQHLLV